MKRSIMIAASAAMLLNACEPSKTPDSGAAPNSSGTDAVALENKGPSPTLAPVDAETRERIEALKKRQASHLRGDDLTTATPSP